MTPRIAILCPLLAAQAALAADPPAPSTGGPRAGPKPSKDESGWKVTRVLSYDHRLTD